MQERGFTLIELLVVALILGVLASGAIVQLQDVTTESRVGSVRANLASMRRAIDTYRVQHDDVWPGIPSAAEARRSPSLSSTPSAATFEAQLTQATDESGNVTAGGEFGPYLRAIPENLLAGNDDVLVVASVPSEPRGEEGWLYAYESGEIRCNVVGTAPDGGAFFDL